MNSTPSSRLIDNMRGVRYGEVLAVFLRDDKLQAEVYGTNRAARTRLSND